LADTRYHYMDSLRAAMMIAGVFFHAAMVYRPDEIWRFTDPSDMLVFTWFTETLHTFRMPAFFAVAGFFCAFVFAREQGIRTLYSRLVVFGVPFVVMGLTVQPLQYALKLDSHGAFQGFGAGFWRTYFHDGEYISHLWFLINLVAYYVLAWAILRWCRRDYAAVPWMSHVFRHKSLLSLLACAAYLPLHWLLRDLALGKGYEPQVIFEYAPYFIVGYALFRHSALFTAFRQVSLLDLLVLLALLLVDDIQPDTRLGHVLQILTSYQCGFVLTGLCMRLFHRFFDRENRATRVVADSAYTIYLLHQFLVVLFASWAAHHFAAANPFLKYSIVVAAVLAVTITLHQLLIARVPMLRFLVNGRLSASPKRRARLANAPGY
jgi:glucans biosynthesis protein C